MKIIVPKNIVDSIFGAVEKAGVCEIKGALYAKYISSNCYEIEDVFISKNAGTSFFSNLIIGFSYHRFEKNYFKKHNNDFKNHNYIGDWHSHPSFECIPSEYDVKEAFDELRNSNANFLIQLIVKNDGGKLIGNCFLYNDNESHEKCSLVIENE